MPLVLIGPAYLECNVRLLDSVLRGFVYESDRVIFFACDGSILR
jgi:hypothetical protein